MNNLVITGEFLNIAATISRTQALGPGFRNAVWFQGCPFHCEGCISPGWIKDMDANLVYPNDLARSLTKDKTISGLSISGGEPFFQPLGLNKLLKEVNSLNANLTVILFTGYTFSKLKSLPSEFKVNETLSFIDVLIDGLFVKDLNNNRGLRGSTNQTIHRLSNRLDDFDFEHMNRINEVYLRNGELQLSGVPDISVGKLIRTDLERMRVTSYVRP